MNKRVFVMIPTKTNDLEVKITDLEKRDSGEPRCPAGRSFLLQYTLEVGYYGFTLEVRVSVRPSVVAVPDDNE